MNELLPKGPLAVVLVAAAVTLAGSALGAGIVNTMTFRESVVYPARKIAQDLYEPTVTTPRPGTIYVSGHVTAADTTGTPAYVSTDDGQTWRPLPVASDVAAPSPLQGSAPPPGVEGYIVADDAGRAWMVDMAFPATISVTGWCGDGAEQCYYHPDAYDPSEQVGGTCGARVSVTDRPWAAYADDTLLLVNNGASLGAEPGNFVQIGVLDVGDPPAVETRPATWNFCASGEGGIPGVPALRDDGLFAVPHFDDNEGNMTVVTGTTDDISDPTTRELFPAGPEGFDCFAGGNLGWSAFDADGNLYVAGARNDTRYTISVSTDGASTFETASFQAPGEIGQMWLDGSRRGEGALVSFVVEDDGCQSGEFYAAHVTLRGDGTPRVSDVSLVADDVQGPCGDIMGSSLSPDGRAYVAAYEDPRACFGTPGSRPISVFVQQDGPTI